MAPSGAAATKSNAPAKAQHLLKVFARVVPRVDATFDEYAARADPLDAELNASQMYAVDAYTERRISMRTLLVNGQHIQMPKLTPGLLGMLDYDMAHAHNTGPWSGRFEQIAVTTHTSQQWYAILTDYCMKRASVWVHMLYRELMPAAQAFLAASSSERNRLAGTRPHSTHLAIVALYLLCLGRLIGFVDRVATARGYGPNYWLRILNTI